jgi:hypothetical protein
MVGPPRIAILEIVPRLARLRLLRMRRLKCFALGPRGLPMPRYLTQHTLACLTRQGAETLAQRMQEGGPARAERVLVNMLEGKMFAEFRAESREALEAWLASQGMHFDWLVRVEWETRNGKLEIAT